MVGGSHLVSTPLTESLSDAWWSLDVGATWTLLTNTVVSPRSAAAIAFFPLCASAAFAAPAAAGAPQRQHQHYQWHPTHHRRVVLEWDAGIAAGNYRSSWAGLLAGRRLTPLCRLEGGSPASVYCGGWDGGGAEPGGGGVDLDELYESKEELDDDWWVRNQCRGSGREQPIDLAHEAVELSCHAERSHAVVDISFADPSLSGGDRFIRSSHIDGSLTVRLLAATPPPLPPLSSQRQPTHF